jgi:hypothetical protein
LFQLVTEEIEFALAERLYMFEKGGFEALAGDQNIGDPGQILAADSQRELVTALAAGRVKVSNSWLRLSICADRKEDQKQQRGPA